MSGPPYPLEGVVSWNMNTTCNYRCSYCTQRFVEDRKQWARDLPRFVEGFRALPGDWEIKLSGGEPFQHPGVLELVAALAAQGRRVSVVTNLSASTATLARFAELTATRPGLVSASLHLEYTDPGPFRAKVEALREVHRGGVCVTCVATRANLPQLAELRALFDPIPFRVQPEKLDRDVIDYTEAEVDLLAAMGGHNGVGEVAPSYEGRPCWAGARYLIVDHRGEVYRCYPARRRRQERLGNLLDGSFRPRFAPEPCRYTYCNCTVPRQRGMVLGDR